MISTSHILDMGRHIAENLTAIGQPSNTIQCQRVDTIPSDNPTITGTGPWTLACTRIFWWKRRPLRPSACLSSSQSGGLHVRVTTGEQHVAHWLCTKMLMGISCSQKSCSLIPGSHQDQQFFPLSFEAWGYPRRPYLTYKSPQIGSTHSQSVSSGIGVAGLKTKHGFQPSSPTPHLPKSCCGERNARRIFLLLLS